MIWRLALATLVLSVAGLLPGVGMAHLEGPLAGGFAAGFAHPFAGIDHVVGMVALGFWAALGGRTTAWILPAVFVGVVIVGFVGGLGGASLSLAEAGVAASVLALGLLLASGRTPALALAVALAAGFAVFHGVAHGIAAPTSNLVPFAAGLAAATASLHGVGVAAALIAGRQWQTASLGRPAGALTALIGFVLLAGV